MVLPAYAGMIPKITLPRDAEGRAPRVCGDDPSIRRKSICARRCSPRMRG